jgi:hypothetical protein
MHYFGKLALFPFLFCSLALVSFTFFVISAEAAITFGSSSEFNDTDAKTISTAKLDSTHFAACYQDATQSYNAMCRVATTDGGTTINSWGTETILGPGANTDYISISALDSFRQHSCGSLLS